MPLKNFLRRLFPAAPGHSHQEVQRYDNVTVVNVADGTVIQGHDAVKAHFEQEQALLDQHGMNIIFQIYRINMQAITIDELQSEMLAEVKVDGGFVSGDDTVAAVKRNLQSLIEARTESAGTAGAPTGLTVGKTDHMTLYFNHQPMQDDKLFYADHFMLLPAWVQVYLHSGDFRDVLLLADRLRPTAQHAS